MSLCVSLQRDNRCVQLETWSHMNVCDWCYLFVLFSCSMRRTCTTCVPFFSLSRASLSGVALFSKECAHHFCLLPLFFSSVLTKRRTENASETDHPRRLRRRENVADESIREQKIFEAIQSHHRGGFPHERSESGRQFSHHANMGHGWTREIPIARRGILQRRGLC